MVNKGYDTKYGVRFLRRKIQKYLEDPIAELLLKNMLQKGTNISVRASKSGLQFECKDPKKNKIKIQYKASL